MAAIIQALSMLGLPLADQGPFKCCVFPKLSKNPLHEHDAGQNRVSSSLLATAVLEDLNDGEVESVDLTRANVSFNIESMDLTRAKVSFNIESVDLTRAKVSFNIESMDLTRANASFNIGSMDLTRANASDDVASMDFTHGNASDDVASMDFTHGNASNKKTQEGGLVDGLARETHKIASLDPGGLKKWPNAQ